MENSVKNYDVFKFVLLTVSLMMFLNCHDDKENICPGFAPVDAEPAWSPDGEWIAYSGGLADSSGIFLIHPDGTSKHLVAPGFGSGPTWSPDSKWIAFSAGGIYKIKITGDSLTPLVTEGSVFAPSWSPDGQWIAFDSDFNSQAGQYFIWKIRVDGTQNHRIAYDPVQGEIRMPSWSPDSKKIVHIRYLVGVFSSEIFSMDSNGSNPQRITENNSTDYYPKYSQDGKRIVFTSQPENYYTEIWTMSSNGTSKRQLVIQGYSNDWSPDGSKIVYTSSCGDNGGLWIMDSDGGNKHQITFPI